MVAAHGGGAGYHCGLQFRQQSHGRMAPSLFTREKSIGGETIPYQPALRIAPDIGMGFYLLCMALCGIGYQKRNTKSAAGKPGKRAGAENNQVAHQSAFYFQCPQQYKGAGG